MAARVNRRFAPALSAMGALYCATAVALGAYAAHATSAADRARLDTSVLFLFVHGVALIALRSHLHGPLSTGSAAALALGTLLFAGSVGVAVLFGWPGVLAPWGGMLLIGGWLGLAVGLLGARPTGSSIR